VALLIFFIVVPSLKGSERNTRERREGGKCTRWIKERKKGVKYKDIK
jgi:hypothetical protein